LGWDLFTSYAILCFKSLEFVAKSLIHGCTEHRAVTSTPYFGWVQVKFLLNVKLVTKRNDARVHYFNVGTVVQALYLS